MKMFTTIPWCKTHECEVKITILNGKLHVHCPKAGIKDDDVCELCYYAKEIEDLKTRVERVGFR